MNERELKVMRAIARFETSAGLEEIARVMGYRPARRGVLAVNRTLRILMKKDGESHVSQYGESGRYVGRLPPRDRWGVARWFLTDEAKEMVAHDS